MKLTAEQTEQLFRFTKRKMVHHYDLQAELVDHLANMIEEFIEGDASLTFDQALNKAYASFGLFGFAHIVQEKSNQLHRKYEKLWWKEMQKQFKWPEIIFSSLLIVCTWMALEYLDVVSIGIFFFLGWLSCHIIQGALLRQNKRNGKPLLMLQYTAGPNYLFTFFYQLFGWTFISTMNPYVITAIFVTGILVQIATFRLLWRVRTEARQLYPEAFLKVA